MAIKLWEAGVAAALASGFLYFRWRLRNSGRRDQLLGEVQDARRKGLWALEAFRLLILRHETHNTRTVRMQWRKPGTHISQQMQPDEARRVATLLREAVENNHPGERP